MEESIEELKKLWVSMTPNNGTPCAYCGVFATDQEHVTPVSWITRATELRKMGIDIPIPEIKLVPSCHECNMLAFDKIFDTFSEKKNYIRYRLVKKYNKWIFKEQWTDEELEELGGNLRRQTVLYNEVLKAVQARMRHIGAISILRNMDYFDNLYRRWA